MRETKRLLLDIFTKYVIVKAPDANELHLHLELLRERRIYRRLRHCRFEDSLLAAKCLTILVGPVICRTLY